MYGIVTNRLRSLWVMALSVLAIIILSATTLWGTVIFEKWGGLILGAILMLLAIPFHALLGKKSKIGYIISFLLNTVGTGFNASAYYNCKSVCADLGAFLKASFLAIIFLVILGILLVPFKDKKHIFIGIFGCLEVAAIIMIIACWVKYGGEYFAFALFSMVLCTFNTGVYSFTVDEEERGFFRDMSFGSYGYLIVVGLIALAVISGGDACDGCDCGCDGGDCGSGKKSKGKK